MSKIRVAFSINDAYTQHLSVAIYSLLKNNPDNQFEIYVLCKSLTQRNQQLIKNVLKYYKNAEIEFVKLNKLSERFSSLKLTIGYISVETYYRYILAELFPKFDKILYLDADLLVTGDIAELYDMDIENFYAAGVEDRYVATVNHEGKEVEYPNYKEAVIGFGGDDFYANAGVLLFNLKVIRKDDIVAKLFENTIALTGKILFQDQDILNITLRGKIKPISNIFNYTDHDKRENNRSLTELRIIHYTGATKPWANAIFSDFQIPFVGLYRGYVDEFNQLMYGTTDKFALYTFSTENIGDDIQAIAARRFLPRVDYTINRDLVGEWRNVNRDEKVKLIANGWYMHNPYKWPIEDKTIDPLYTSMYVEQMSPSVLERLLSTESKENFAAFGKIGARDESTLDFLKKNDIDAYLSGCLTLTLQKDKRIKKEDFILLTDVSIETYEFIKKSTKRKVIYLTNAINTHLQTPADRNDLAEIYLYLYQSAHCVITERLHSALPSLAFETPVLLLKKEEPIGGNKNRFSGLGELAHYHSEQEFLTGKIYNVDKPPKNPTGYLKYRKELIKIAERFTHFNNEDSFAWSDIAEKPLEEVLDQLELIKIKHLRTAATELIQAVVRENVLSASISQQDTTINIQNQEIARLMGITPAAKRLAGNIKRRIIRHKNGS